MIDLIEFKNIPRPQATVGRRVETTHYPDIAKKLYSKGYLLAIIKPGEKFPITKGWQSADTAELVDAWPDNHGIGIRCGKGLVAVDIDIYDNIIIECLLSLFNFPHLTRIGQPPKVSIPEQSGHLFHGKADSDSIPIRTPIPFESGQ